MRPLRRLGFQFLQAHHIRALALEPRPHLGRAGPDAVDIPCGDFHLVGCASPHSLSPLPPGEGHDVRDPSGSNVITSSPSPEEPALSERKGEGDSSSFCCQVPEGGMVTTILPFARPCSTYAIASSVSSNGNVRSSTGRRVPASYRAANVFSCAPSARMKKNE